MVQLWENHQSAAPKSHRCKGRLTREERHFTVVLEEDMPVSPLYLKAYVLEKSSNYDRAPEADSGPISYLEMKNFSAAIGHQSSCLN